MTIKRKTLFPLFIALELVLAGSLSSRYSAEILAKRAASSLDTYDYSRAADQWTAALSKNPAEPRLYLGRAKTYLLLYAVEEQGVYKLKALADLKQAQRLNVQNLVTLRNSVSVYYFLALKDFSTSQTTPVYEDQYFREAADFLAGLKSHYAHDVGVLVLVAEYEKKLGLTQEYLASREKIKLLRPDLLDWRLLP